MTRTSTPADNPSETAVIHYVIDGRASRFTVRAFASGLLSAMGHNPTIAIRDFTGGMDFDPDKLDASAFQLAIKASSLSVQDDISAQDRREMERLMNEEVLESTKFTEIRYEAAAISISSISDMLYTANLDGQLTLHGVTRPQPIVARVALFGSMLRASGEFALKQTDYGIKLVSVAGGALKLKDELKFSFEIVARRQE
ncbi:MAG: YceI family protein [Silvibacterium sp.]|nr:YceI family protein [Silvibacterium sp.]